MKTNHILWLFALLWVVAACGGDDPECPAQPPVTAEFTMGKRFYDTGENSPPHPLVTIDTIFTDDTFLTWDPIIFRAPPGFERYEWQVGYDDRPYTDSVFVLRFPDPQQDLPVRLIVQGEPDLDCFPDDDGIDTLTRLLNIVDLEQSPLTGTYLGAHEATPTDTFRVWITYDEVNSYQLHNINPGCSPDTTGSFWIGGAEIKRGYRFAFFTGERSYLLGCQGPVGTIQLDESLQQITINYSIGDKDAGVTPWPRTSFRFTGQRLN